MPASAEENTNRKNRSALGRAAKVMAWSILAVLLVTGGLLVYLLNAPDTTRSLLERYLTALTDRPFHINGDFDLTLGRSVVIRAADVAWENPSWSEMPNMMTIGEIELAISTESLFRPPVVISNSSAQDAKLEFEWTEDGKFNWDFFPGDENKTDDGSTHPLPLLLDTTTLQNIELTFKSPELTESLVWQVKAANQQQDEQNFLAITATTELDKRPVTLDGRIGPFPELLVAGKVELTASVKGPVQSIDVNASVDDLSDLSGADLDLTWQAPDVAMVLDMLNLPPEATKGSVDVEVKLVTENDITKGNIDGNVGEFSVDGEITAPDKLALTDLHLAIRSKGPSAGAVGRLLGIKGLPKDSYQLEVKADTIKTGLNISNFYAQTGDAQINGTALLPRPPSLNDADLSLKITGNNLARFQGMTRDVVFIEAPFSADVELKGNGDGKPDSLTGKLALADISVDVQASLAETPDYTGSTIDYSLVSPEGQKLVGMFGLPLLKTAKLTASGKATIVSQGAQLNDLTLSFADNKIVLNGLIPRDLAKQPVKLNAASTGSSFNGLMRYFLPLGLGPSLPFSLKGTQEFDPDGMFKTNSTGKVGATEVNLKGRINLAGSKTDTELDISASGPSLNDWLSNLIREEKASQAFKLAAKLQITDTNLKVSNLKLSVRDAELSGNVTSDWPDHPERLSFDVSAQGKNMAEELPDFKAFKPAAVAFNIKARGNLDETHIEFDNLNATIGSAVAKIKGSAGIPPVVSAESLAIDIRGDKLADLGTLEGWEFKDNAFAITATINTEGNTLKADDVNLQLGPNDFSGQFTYEASDKPNIDIDISSKKIDIGAGLTKEQNDALAAGMDSSSSSEDGRVIPDVEIPVDILNTFDGQAKLRLDKITLAERELSGFSATATLKDGDVQIPDLAANTTFGDIKGSLHLRPGNETYSHELNLDLHNVRLGDTLQAATDKYPYTGHTLNIWLTGTGTNLRQIAASANGFFWMRGGKRQIQNIKYESMFGDFFTNIVKKMNPFMKKDPYTTVDCDRYYFELTDGKMETAPIVLIKTERINFLSAGSIDLSTERIKLGIETQPRKGVGISASDILTPFVAVGGTLDKPKASWDKKGTLVQGGAAYATLGLSIVAKGLYDRWLKKDKSCADYDKIALEVRTKRDPNHIPAD